MASVQPDNHPLRQLMNQLNAEIEEKKQEQTKLSQSLLQSSGAHTRSMAFMPNPFSWAFEKIFAKYRGQLNNGIDEILKNAEIKVTMPKGATQPGYNNSVNINIRVAAGILDEYASLLKFFIEEDTTTPSDIKQQLHQEHQQIDLKREQLQAILVKHAVHLMNYNIHTYINELLQAGCAFGLFNFCYRSRVKQLTALSDWTTELANHESIPHHVLIGALMLVFDKIDTFSNKDDKAFIHKELESIFNIDNLIIDKEARKPFIQDFQKWGAIIRINALNEIYMPPDINEQKKDYIPVIN